ncbi:hypothetical protein GGR58DRAFT_523237 [Xylaria digitata]|nr:hypothetical protein GGR58DRAFT_523237 [Xylaria digitata]
MSTTTRPVTTKYSSSSSTSSTDSDTSYRLSMDVRPVASVEVLRCLRCHRHVETTSTDDLASTGMIRVGFNLYYCTKCAAATIRTLKQIISTLTDDDLNGTLVFREEHRVDFVLGDRKHSCSRCTTSNRLDDYCIQSRSVPVPPTHHMGAIKTQTQYDGKVWPHK